MGSQQQDLCQAIEIICKLATKSVAIKLATGLPAEALIGSFNAFILETVSISEVLFIFERFSERPSATSAAGD